MTTDIQWITDQQPDIADADPARTAAMRTALLEHIAVASTPRRRRPVARAAAALGVAAAIAAVAVVGGTDLLHVDTAEASALTSLSHEVRASAPPSGDATLVRRVHTFADGSTMTGADLYLDDGTYYYAPTYEELPARIVARLSETSGAVARGWSAAIAALRLDDDAARRTMARANVDPTDPPRSAPDPDDPDVAAQRRAREAEGPVGTLPPATPAQLLDGAVWSNALDTLVAGAGRRDVRAGVLRVLATVDTVDVRATTTGGRDVLALRARLFPDGYVEHLTIDATTGVPLRFEGGYPGARPTVVVTYDVQRVTAATLAAG